MKNKLGILLLIVTVAGWHTAAEAQIRDNDASANLLAVQCAVSSGFSADDFEDYSRSLAKTLGMLNAAQQVKVFGYLPLAAAGGARGTETNELQTSDSQPVTTEGQPEATVESASSSGSEGSSADVAPADGTETTLGSQVSGSASGTSGNSESSPDGSNTPLNELLARIIAAIRELGN